MIDIKALASRLNAIALPLARSRLETMGEDASGTYHFYAVRIGAGDLFSRYDLRLAEAIHAAPGLPHRVHEVGGGFGNLSWLLAALGHDVVCFEHDTRRFEAATALTAAIAEAWPEVGARCRIVRESFPARGIDGAGAMFVATNMIHTTTPARRASIVAAVARYDVAILDVDRFCAHASTPEERAAVIAEFRNAGMEGAPFLDVGKSANFHRFAGRPRTARPRTGGTVIAPDHADILKRRGVDRIAYFHTDHFEPWRPLAGQSADSTLAICADGIVKFSERVADRYFARRLTLHYLPELAIRGRGDPAKQIQVEGDNLGVLKRTPHYDATARAAFAAMDGRHDFDFQVHFHHEALTWNTEFSQRNALRRHLRSEDVPLNQRRFDMGLAEALRRIRNDTGRALENWFFVHGLWALNASDHKVCAVTDEIIRLKAAGALGDFTFPAGRPECDPSFDYPALVRPFDAVKCYSRGEADPRPAGTVDADDRFFIWSSRAAHGDCSIDYFSEGVAANFRTIDAWASRLLLNGYQRGSTLYVKTHAHSLYPFYFTDEAGRPGGMFPHERDEIARLMECFEDAAAAVGGHVAYLQASEVYAELMAPQAPVKGKPPVDGYVETGLTFPRAPIEKAEAEGLAVLGDLLATVGASESGLEGVYEMLVARERVIRPTEIEIANLLQRLFPARARVTHFRTAVGILPIGLAAGGLRVRSVERSRKRVAIQRQIAGRVGLGRLSRQFRVVRRRLEDITAGDVRGRYLLFTDAGAPFEDAQTARLIALFDQAEMVVLDVLRFCGRRTVDEIGPLVARLRGADGAPAERILDLGPDGVYYCIDNRAVKRPFWWRLAAAARG